VTPSTRNQATRVPHVGLAHVVANIELATTRGLEIGPLHNPIVWRDESTVFYVDHADTEALRAKYANDPNVPEVLDVDFVWGDRPLAEAVGDAAPFDYVVASHVIEHVPDPVSWLKELAGVLRPGGIISLVVPDKRYCFDARRSTTDVSDIVASHLERRTQPTLAQIFDFEARYAPVDSLAVWAGQVGYDEGQPLRLQHALERCQAAQQADGYIDVHATTWTPASFVEALRVLFELGWLDVRVASFTPTPFNFLEFYVSLERLPVGLSDVEKRSLQLDSLPSVTDADPPKVDTMSMSDRERRLIEIKRSVLASGRRFARRLRR
jgi:SAM-dependent methyltransferase